MQSAPRAPGQPPPVKIYNAVYSSVQVYECMVRGIAVMRRRTDSYVNATQILKVAGIEKGRRTKILEKDVLPGKHEIVQGGYGKYQGTWIPLERGRELAAQYGVSPQLAPLFDFTPAANSFAALPAVPPGTASPRPLSAAASPSFGSLTGQSSSNAYPQNSSSLAPPPIMPGSALRLLNQGRAQGLFTPSTSGQNSRPFAGSPSPYPQSLHSQTPPPSSQPTLKRKMSENDMDGTGSSAAADADADMDVDGVDMPSPTKKARTSPPPGDEPAPRQPSPQKVPTHLPRMSTKPVIPRHTDPSAPSKDPRKKAIFDSIFEKEDVTAVLDGLRQLSADAPSDAPPDGPYIPEVDSILDSYGHTALHIAASMSRHNLIAALLAAGADMYRGNYNGETPLIRACISTPPFTHLTFPNLLDIFQSTMLVLDTSRRSILHHICSLAGVRNKAPEARYYLDQVFKWIAQNSAEAGFGFSDLVDLQDEHGDTALNISARVGNRSLVKTLLDAGANRILPNKLGLRPGDFGVETEELNVGVKAEDILSVLRTGPPAPVQKCQDVLAGMTTMIQTLSTEFQAELKVKQDALDVNQAHLRAATRELSEQRKQMNTWQTKCAELDQVSQRVKNLERALQEEDTFDWSGRDAEHHQAGHSMNGDAVGILGINNGGPAFVPRGNAVAASIKSAIGSAYMDVDPPLPTSLETVETLIRLRRMKLWQSRMENLLAARIKDLQGTSAVKEFQFRKIVALCAGLPIDKVEDQLENLIAALDSEKTIVDIGRVSGFMQKVGDNVN